MLRKKKKFFKILSVLVAVIIVFSSFSISATSITGDKYLDKLNFSTFQMSIVRTLENGSLTFSSTDITPVGFSGDGSLKILVTVVDPDFIVIPPNTTLEFRLRFLGSSDGFYCYFPDIFNISKLYGQAPASLVSDNLIYCDKTSSLTTLICRGSSLVSFSQFYVYLSLTDPTYVPPMTSFINDITDFFGFSSDNVSNAFSIFSSNYLFFILILGFSIVGFFFGILYRIKKR